MHGLDLPGWAATNFFDQDGLWIQGVKAPVRYLPERFEDPKSIRATNGHHDAFALPGSSSDDHAVSW
jgi:hypothetical protein